MTHGTKLYAWFEVDKRERGNEREREERPIIRKERIINAKWGRREQSFFGRR